MRIYASASSKSHSIRKAADARTDGTRDRVIRQQLGRNLARAARIEARKQIRQSLHGDF